MLITKGTTWFFSGMCCSSWHSSVPGGCGNSSVKHLVLHLTYFPRKENKIALMLHPAVWEHWLCKTKVTWEKVGDGGRAGKLNSSPLVTNVSPYTEHEKRDHCWPSSWVASWCLSRVPLCRTWGLPCEVGSEAGCHAKHGAPARTPVVQTPC